MYRLTDIPGHFRATFFAWFPAFLGTTVLFTIYPAVCALMRPERYFGPVMIGMQNVGELIGRYVLVFNI